MRSHPASAEGRPAVQDAYPLTPLQSGMLYHTLRAKSHGPYLEQFVFDLTGVVDPERLVDAWTRTINNHTALRTAFFWEGVDEPIQAVVASCTVPVSRHDASSWPTDEFDRRLQNFLDQDRRRGFTLSDVPLMRLALFGRPGGFVLVWTVHHLILDGWSMPIILREVAASYRASDGELAPGAPATSSFRPFVDWLGRQDTGPAAAFWREQLHGMKPVGLRSLRPGVAEERRGQVDGGIGRHDLSAELSALITDAARAVRVSLSTWFQGAWALLLAHHTGEKDITFGVTVAGRPTELPGAQTTVGPFINTVPQRVNVADATPLADWLRTVREQHLRAQPFEHLGLTDIQGCTTIPAGEPLFESLVVFENYPGENPDFDLGHGCRAVLRNVVEDTGYPLTLMVLPRRPRIRLQLLADTSRFSEDTVRTLLGRLEALLAAMARGQDEPVRAASVLTPQTRAMCLVEWNQTRAPLPAVPVHTSFEEQVSRMPAATAIEYAGTRVSYTELDRRAAELAARLAALGVGPDTVVGLLQRRSVDALVSVLAVLKSGGAYMALDPTHPDSRLRFMVEDSRAVLVVTEEAFAARVRDWPVRCLLADVPEAEPPTPIASVPVSLDHLCYVTYTSGSTGRPKGIAMPHGPVANLNDWQNDQARVTAQAKTFAYASLSFDVSFQEMFATWTSGGTLVLVDDEHRTDYASLVTLGAEAGVQRWYLPAPALAQVADTCEEIGRPLPALREVIPGSEALRVTPQMRRLLAQAPGCTLENQYGPSECHVVTSHVVPEPPESMPDSPPIGRPIANTRIYLLDDRLEPVPPGVIGSLYIAGAGLARGYLGRAGLTAERFLPDPFGDQPGGRMYDTGDLACHLPDGVIEFHGRTDGQVKIRGFRIELGEVESVLRGLEGIRDAVVVVREVGGDRRLVAYVVPAAGQPVDLDTEEVLTQLGLMLPSYMIPWLVVPLATLPLTVNRKVDLSALPEAMPPAPDGPTDDFFLRPAAQVMRSLWSDVLGIETNDPDSDFFRLGGHSLSAIRLTGRMRTAFSVSLGIGVLFSLRTQRRLLSRIDADLGGADETDRVALSLLKEVSDVR